VVLGLLEAAGHIGQGGRASFLEEMANAANAANVANAAFRSAAAGSESGGMGGPKSNGLPARVSARIPS
jgi:hypothetical protein